ncbi:hypothetical protein PSEUDO8Z_100176 [Pseudomonas sp. 8Z]|nr:hypothetical protein PSEUDO8Z_100176 [Pseudomonas sp. 8Z]
MIRHFVLVSDLHRLPLASLYWRTQIYLLALSPTKKINLSPFSHVRQSTRRTGSRNRTR